MFQIVDSVTHLVNTSNDRLAHLLEARLLCEHEEEVERGEKIDVVRGEVIVEIIVGVQNDDTAPITLSTS